MFTTLRFLSCLFLLCTFTLNANNLVFSLSLANKTAPKTVLLLAHRWTSKTLLLDLHVDGSFEGRFGSNEELYGLWEVDKQRKTLLLQNDPIDEEVFQRQYTIVEVSFDRLRLKDASGKFFALSLVE